MTRSSAFANWQKLMSIDIKSETTSPAKAVQLPDPCPRLREPLRVCYDVVSDTLYVSDYQNHAIRKFKDGEQGTLACADENGESFCGPVGLCIDALGNVYMADCRAHKIRKISPAGVVTTIAGSTQGHADGVPGQFDHPISVLLDPDERNLYVVDLCNQQIRKICLADGNVTTVAGSTEGDADGTPGKFNRPSAVCFDNNGDLLVTDCFNHKIKRVYLETGSVKTVAGDGTRGYSNEFPYRFNYPRGVIMDTDGSFLIGDTFNSTIRVVRISDKEFPNAANVTQETNTEESPLFVSVSSLGVQFPRKAGKGFVRPCGMTLDLYGNIYVCDSGSNKLWKLERRSYSLNLMSKLLANPVHSDMSISSTDGVCFSVHKALASIRCPSLLNESVIDLNSSNSKLFIEFLYTNELNVHACTDLFKFAAVAKKLDFSDLNQMCRKKLTPSLNTESIFPFLMLCLECGHEYETQVCLEFLAKRNVPIPYEISHQIVKYPEFLVKLYNAKTSGVDHKPLVCNNKPVTPLPTILERIMQDTSYADHIVDTGNYTIPVHSFILDHAWDFFKILSRTTAHETTMPESTFLKLIRFFYTGRFSKLDATDAAWLLYYKEYYLLSDSLDSYLNSILNRGFQNDSAVKELISKLNNPNILQDLPPFQELI